MGKKRYAKKRQDQGDVTVDGEFTDVGMVAAAIDALAEETGMGSRREPLEDHPELQALYAEEGRKAFYERLDRYVGKIEHRESNTGPQKPPDACLDSSSLRRNRVARALVRVMLESDGIVSEIDADADGYSVESLIGLPFRK